MGGTKVGKDSRLPIPARIIRAAGLSPGDIVEDKDIILRRRGHNRRTFLRWLIGGGAFMFVSNLEDNIAFLERVGRLADPDVDPEILHALFGAAPAPSGAIIPSGDHPFDIPPPGKTWYPIEEACSVTYQMRFAADAVLRRVAGRPRLRPQDSVIAFGSQVSNLYVRDILGNPWQDQPVFHVAGPGWSTDLHWNLHSPPDAPTASRRQYGNIWITVEHEIVSGSGAVYQVNYEDGVARNDYLLITSLPRGAAENPQRSLIFGGIHGAGTLSAQRLLHEPPARLLQDIFTHVGGARHYQALIRVAVRTDDSNEAKPGAIDLIDARPLELAFERSNASHRFEVV
jgi:hypothetical protein